MNDGISPGELTETSSPKADTESIPAKAAQVREQGFVRSNVEWITIKKKIHIFNID